jgi:hypothetical protein
MSYDTRTLFTILSFMMYGLQLYNFEEN